MNIQIEIIPILQIDMHARGMLGQCNILPETPEEREKWLQQTRRNIERWEMEDVRWETERSDWSEQLVRDEQLHRQLLEEDRAEAQRKSQYYTEVRAQISKLIFDADADDPNAGERSGHDDKSVESMRLNRLWRESNGVHMALFWTIRHKIPKHTYELYAPSAEKSHTHRLNLDVSTLLTYVSALTNGSVEWDFENKLLNHQVYLERRHPMKPILDRIFEGNIWTQLDFGWIGISLFI